jgi:glycosyltransferase involved in cell wall biosynthesis
VHVFGRVLPEDRALIARYDLERMIQEHGSVEHRTVLGHMAGADILFLPSGSDVDYALPFKLYDYLSVKRPILAVAPRESAVAQFMAEVDCGELAVIHDSASVQNALRTMLRRSEPYTFAGSERYHWGRLADTYARILHDVVRGQ